MFETILFVVFIVCFFCSLLKKEKTKEDIRQKEIRTNQTWYSYWWQVLLIVVPLVACILTKDNLILFTLFFVILFWGIIECCAGISYRRKNPKIEE